jgi:hypothetical protein
MRKRVQVFWESFKDHPVPEVVLSKYGLKSQDCNSSLYNILYPGWGRNPFFIRSILPTLPRERSKTKKP